MVGVFVFRFARHRRWRAALRAFAFFDGKGTTAHDDEDKRGSKNRWGLLERLVIGGIKIKKGLW